jgi:hypothetical protein
MQVSLYLLVEVIDTDSEPLILLLSEQLVRGLIQRGVHVLGRKKRRGEEIGGGRYIYRRNGGHFRTHGVW